MGMAPISALKKIAAATVRDRFLIAARRGLEVEESADKVAALLDTARALREVGAPHALIGGVAVGIHSGVPRARRSAPTSPFCPRMIEPPAWRR